MFSVRQKREISEAIQKTLRSTGHPELPEGEIQFHLTVNGEADWSFADIQNNGAVLIPDVNLHNESMDPVGCGGDGCHGCTACRKESGEEAENVKPH